MNEPLHPQRRKAVAMLILATFFWGLSFPIIKAILLVHAGLEPEASRWFVVACTLAPRCLLTSAILIAWRGKALRQTTRRELEQGLVVAFFSVGGMFLQNDGLQYTAASTSAFLTQFYVLAIPIWIALRTWRNPGWGVWVSSALVAAGMAILGHFDWRLLRFGRGETETLLSSFFFMGQILWIGKKSYAANDPVRMTFVMMGTQALAFSGLAAAAAPGFRALAVPLASPSWLGLTATLGILPTFVSYLIMNRWQPKITATEAGLIYGMEPIFGSLLALALPAWFSAWAGIHYPDERMSAGLVFGGAMITLANILIQIRPPRE